MCWNFKTKSGQSLLTQLRETRTKTAAGYSETKETAAPRDPEATQATATPLVSPATTETIAVEARTATTATGFAALQNLMQEREALSCDVIGR